MKAGAYKTARKYFFYQTCSSDTCQKTIFRVISLHRTAQQWYLALVRECPLPFPWACQKLGVCSYEVCPGLSRVLHWMHVCAAPQEPLQSQANLDISHPSTRLHSERTCAVQHSTTSQTGLFTFKYN